MDEFHWKKFRQGKLKMKKEERAKLESEKFIRMNSYENQLKKQGYKHIAGVDEVGRGPLAGPVVSAAVILPDNFNVLGIDDSKKLSEKKRKSLFQEIKENAVAIGYGFVDEKIIDRINILEATKLSMKIAIENLQENLAYSEKIDCVLIDALTLKNVELPQMGIVKGDQKSISIAAASILAKVTRDKIMEEYHDIYPDYGFDKNKGYGTKLHYEGLEKEGLCPIHRRTFLKKLK